MYLHCFLTVSIQWKLFCDMTKLVTKCKLPVNIKPSTDIQVRICHLPTHPTHCLLFAFGRMRSRASLFCQCYSTSCCFLLFRNCIYHSDSISSAFAKLSKSATTFVMSVRPSAQEHLVYRWTYFRNHFILGGEVLKSARKSRVGLKSYENNRHFT